MTSIFNARVSASVATVMSGVLAAGVLVLVAPAAQAATRLVVAPSPNGLVMRDVPTTVTATGFKGTAKLFRFDKNLNSWALIGSVKAGKSRNYTFPAAGVTQVKVVPAKGKQRTIKVSVYERFTLARHSTEPTRYGETVLPARNEYLNNANVAIQSQAGCRLVDIGVNAGGSEQVTVRVSSTGAPEFTARVARNQSQAFVGVPVAGSIVLTTEGVAFSASPYTQVGLVWTCLAQP